MPRPLPDGLYEHLVTEDLERDLAALEPSRGRAIDEVSQADVHEILARHIGMEFERTLAALPREGRVEVSRQFATSVLEHLAGLARGQGLDGEPIEAQRVPEPARQLMAVHTAGPPERPTSSLATSTLLTRNRFEPSLGHELGCEIAAADRIDAIVAFVTVGGVRSLREALERFALRSAGQERMRLLTTTFTGTTEAAALDQLARLPGVRVKISYDARRTRLHAKAWMFHRDSGLTTGYVGSANWTATALGSGQEWMVKICAADLPHVVEKFEGTFETLWRDPEFEDYDPSNEAHRTRLQEELRREGSEPGADVSTLVTLRPYPFQEEILDKLAAERAVHGRRRNLVVAATGTGKTVIAAFDYARIAATAGVAPRLLFLAHRREILIQALHTFRHALQDGGFGELLTGTDLPARFDHVFATIQSFSAGNLLHRFGADYWRHVIVDECHHVPAASYQAVVPILRPEILVGLTATPERADGQSLLPDFDGHIAAELRLWHALEQQLLVPFEYYGIADSVDLSRVRWTRTGYDSAALADLYTGNDARAKLALEQLRRRVGDVRAVRGLGFCVSVEHAEFMAARFTAAGLPSLAVHGGTPPDVRADGPRRLRERDVNVLFTCDLYNEGIDLPFVDTLLLLRPTMSATVFLQQLGRGLRHHDRKSTCLVLDFIGQHREEFRFDAVLAALTGIPRPRLPAAVRDGFPFLPSGCAVELDAVARETILRGLRGAVAGVKLLASELREVAGRMSPVTLKRFLEETGRDVEEVYGDKHGWATVRKVAGLDPATLPEVEDVSRRLGWLLHIDEPARLRSYARVLATAGQATPLALDQVDRVRMHMLEFQLSHRGVLRAAEETAAYLAAQPLVADEFNQLGEVLADRIALSSDIYPVPEWPLALHRHYRRREIVAAVGRVSPGEKGSVPQGGILRLPSLRREILFVTLDKSGRGFSPTTRYRDYAISRDLFHWETQAAASVTRPSGRRYLDSLTNGWSFYVFVRADPDAAYAFLGPAKLESHTGDRPIAITWRLAHSLPAALFDRYATLANA